MSESETQWEVHTRHKHEPEFGMSIRTPDREYAGRYADRCKELWPGIETKIIEVGVTPVELTEAPKVYASAYRPISTFTLPRYVTYELVTRPWDGYEARVDLKRAPAPWRYGTFTTDRPLTEEELEHFDIKVVGL